MMFSPRFMLKHTIDTNRRVREWTTTGLLLDISPMNLRIRTGLHVESFQVLT